MHHHMIADDERSIFVCVNKSEPSAIISRIPRGCYEQVAFQQADYVAWNVWAAINGRPLLPFKYQHLGDMMSLGSVNGAVTLPLPVPGPLADGLRVGY